MSYDIWLEIDTGGSEPKEVAEIGNMTSNVSGMWFDALGHSLGDYHGKACAGVIEPLQKAIKRLEDPANKEKYEGMEPDNGWGDQKGAVEYLKKLLAGCIENPKATIAIWA